MITFIVSDLHLMDRSEAFLFNERKEASFARLCEIILENAGQLILAGDIFDFTGMTPCQRGQAEFFTEAVPVSRFDMAIAKNASTFRSTDELLKATQKAFPLFFESLTRLAEKKALSYIPGNHDCDFLETHARESLAQILRVPTSSIHWTNCFNVGESLFVGHGNEYDASNRTDRGCQNPGFLFTSAIYQAVLPALKMLGVEQTILAAIPAVRPEEETVIGIEKYLGKDQNKKLLLALTKLLQRNGFFQGPSAIWGWLLNNELPWISSKVRAGVSSERVRALLPKEEDLMRNAYLGAKNLRRELKSRNLGSDNTIIVLGHTHELDFRERYFNLGTWNDHIRGLDPEDIAMAEVSLPALIYDEWGDAFLYNLRPLSGQRSLLDCPIIASIRHDQDEVINHPPR